MNQPLPPGVKIESGHGGLPVIKVRTELAEADVYLHGAHVTHFQPAGEKPVLYLSPNSKFEPGKAIRGGIPICWPWFGPHPTDPKLPQHGYARVTEWKLHSADTSAAEIRLQLTTHIEPVWLRYTVTVGRSLITQLETENQSDQPMTITEALHTYLAVGDVRQIAVRGLRGTTYLDRPTSSRLFDREDAVRFTGEVDRTYVDRDGPIQIIDPIWNRQLNVSKCDSKSTVVWNPGPVRGAAIADVGGDVWPNFVCVETANAADNAVTIPPGGRHSMQSAVTVDSSDR